MDLIKKFISHSYEEKKCDIFEKEPKYDEIDAFLKKKQGSN